MLNIEQGMMNKEGAESNFKIRYSLFGVHYLIYFTKELIYS